MQTTDFCDVLFFLNIKKQANLRLPLKRFSFRGASPLWLWQTLCHLHITPLILFY